jgi:calcineurin-like phosphoesterase family protein
MLTIGAAGSKAYPRCPFRRHIPPVALFFTSDSHFGDHRVLNLYKRPFASVAEMDAALVASWNAVVGPEDEVWHLGDFALRGADALLARLNGRKHLVAGNNDSVPVREAAGWASVTDYAELPGPPRLVLCHFPFRTWNGMGRGAFNLHGHSHGRLKGLRRQIDVGVDVWDYRPVALERLLAGAGRRQ